MPFLHNKKADLNLTYLAEIILVLLAAGLIIYVFTYAAGRAGEKTSENLCRGLNAIRFGTKIDKGPVTLNLAPRACKTLDKKDLPGKDYRDYPGGLKEGAKAELRDMIAKCWYMWLEGRQPNMFDTTTTAFQNKCFVCYTFSLQDGTSITVPELVASLDSPYEAIDISEKCNAGNQGGFCRASCDKSSSTPRTVPSSKCKENERCCIAEDARDECINKGGVCRPAPLENYKPYTKWTCKTGACYVQNENFITYRDYVQGTNRATGGAGFIAYDNKLKDSGFANKKYGVTIVSPGNTPSWDTFFWGTATIVSPFAEYYLFRWLRIVSLPTGVGIGAVSTSMLWEMTKKSGTLAGYNFIYLSEYDTISNKCALEYGVDGR